MDNRTVTIPIEDYDYLNLALFRYSTLIDFIKRNAKLCYDDKLDLKYGELDTIISTLLPNDYEEIITKLKADREFDGGAKE